MNSDSLEAIRQEHESWLAELEGLAVEAISSNNWDAFYAHVVDFQNEHDLHGESGIAITPTTLELFFPRVSVTKNKASADRLHSSSADLHSQPQTTRLRTTSNHVTTARTNAESTGVDGLSERPGDNTAHARKADAR